MNEVPSWHTVEATAATQVWRECSQDDFDYGLNVLPPALMLPYGHMVGEAWTHTMPNGIPTYQAFVQSTGKFYKAVKPMTRAEFRKVDIHQLRKEP